MKNVKVLSFMAVSKGRAATEEVVAKRLQGVAAGTIEAVNPDLKTIKELFPHSQATEEPKYVGTTTVKNSKDMDVEVPQIRIALIFKTDPAISTNNGIEATLNIPIFLAKGYSYSHKNGITKVKVIDKYGRTGWATQEEVKTHEVPQYANGPANIDKEYHPCLIGEDELVSLIIAYLGLPRPDVWNDDTKKFEMKRKIFNESYSCALVNKYSGTGTPCKFSCIGIGDCVKICPQNAIYIKNNTAVVSKQCIGCGKCVEICPLQIIRLIPKNTTEYTICANKSDEKSGCNEELKTQKVVWNEKKHFKIWATCYRIFKDIIKK